ncbi:MAG: FAD:protein FMN transferase [Ginsengibacter sp.]
MLSLVRIFFITFVSTFFFLPAFAQYKKFVFQQPKMGSPFNIVIYGIDSGKAAEAAAATFRLIDTLNTIYSDYLPQSELNNLSATFGNWVSVSERLFSILHKSAIASRKSKGSFDITIGPLTKLWRRSRHEKQLPETDSLAAARALVNYHYIELDTVHKRVLLKKVNMQLDLGGIAKGETAQHSYDRLKAFGFPYSLVDAGGDIVAGAVPDSVKSWKIAINMPESEKLMKKVVNVNNKAVATSGDLYQYVELNGKRYSHIIDPVSGYATITSRNVTVIADSGADADWLATACSILPIRKALKLVKRNAAEVQITILKNNKPYFYRSRGFISYFK